MVSIVWAVIMLGLVFMLIPFERIKRIWKAAIVSFVIFGWSLECEGFMMDDDEALDYIDDAFANRETVVAEMRLPSGKKFKGTCIVSEFPLDGAATNKLTLTGTGSLTKITA